MKRFVILPIVIMLFLMSCDKEQAKRDEYEAYQKHLDSVYNEADSIPKYIYNVVVNGDTEDYYNLYLFYTDRNSYEILPFSIIMADKYHYAPAYEDAFTYIWYNSGAELYSLKGLDPKSKATILKYLKLSYKAGSQNAINIVDSLHIKF
jgi:hypothetical protein